MKLKTSYTFELFWDCYHTVNPQYKLNTSRAKELFNNINCIGKKKNIIQGIKKSKLSGLDYLKSKLS